MKKMFFILILVLTVVFLISCGEDDSKKKSKNDTTDADSETVDEDAEEETDNAVNPDLEEQDTEKQDNEEQDNAVEPDIEETDDDFEEYDEDIYDPFANVICVAVTGNDNTGDGSVSAPFATIGKAIDAAVAGKKIYVSAGDYNETLVINKDNIEISGGFDQDFKRDETYYINKEKLGNSDTNITRIISSEESVVTFDGNLKNVVFEGFSVESTRNTGYSSSAVVIKSGSPVISYNTLIAGNPKGGILSGLSGSVSGGIGIGGGNAIIHNNKIFAGEAVDNYTKIGTPTAVSIGIVVGEMGTLGSVSKAAPEIYNNLVVAGHSKDEGTDGGNVGIGIYRNEGSLKIHGNIISAGENKYKARSYGVLLSQNEGLVVYNNIIYGGKGTDLTASVYFYNSTDSKVYNNTLDCGDSTVTTTAVKFSGKYSTPEVKNNLLFCIKDYNPVYEFNANQITPFAPVFENNVIIGGNTGVTIMGPNNSSDANYKSATNIYLPSSTVDDIGFVDYATAAFADKDFHLTAASKNVDGKDITTAGDDLSTVFTTDKDGVIRTAPWSAGAFELD